MSPRDPNPSFAVQWGDSPLVAAAIHHGHEIRPELDEWLALDEPTRLREEDPFTGQWTSIASTRIVANRSRFEVDLNRSRDKAVYLTAAEAWGLDVWKQPPDAELLSRSLAEYDAFYGAIGHGLEELIGRFGRVVVLDLHSYNHRRQGPNEPPADPGENPEVILGTSNMDPRQWAPIVERFAEELRGADFLGRRLDVRLNVKFTGGHFPRWIHRTFPGRACVLAIEWKKFFMDEWSGEPDPVQFSAIGGALQAAADGILKELARP